MLCERLARFNFTSVRQDMRQSAGHHNIISLISAAGYIISKRCLTFIFIVPPIYRQICNCTIRSGQTVKEQNQSEQKLGAELTTG